MLRALIVIIAAAPALAAPAAPAAPAATTSIDDYVAAPDDSYAFEVVAAHPGDGATTFVVDMVSQHWLTADEVDRPEWRHWLVVVVPDSVVSDVGLLFIGGGSNGRDAPAGNERIARIALATGTVTAELGTVPNQPLVFHGDGAARYEDDLIAYAWRHVLEGGDLAWLPRGPMVKSAVRAMDTVSAVAADNGKDVGRFVVAGGSKRGWTTWLTAAVDERVAAIVPIVIDVLNVDVSMRHHFAAYGFWAPSIYNYVQHGIMERLHHPRLAAIYREVDPYAYLHRLTLPKLVLNAAGDQFFLPDSSRFYWDDLVAEKHLRYVANADHGLDGSDALATLTAFHALVARGGKRPRLSWHRDDDGTLTATTDTVPVEVRLWQATNPEARDFRVETFGRNYASRVIEPGEDGSYAARVPAPERGWTASFLEFAWDVGVGAPLKLTTDVAVVPDTLPFADKPPGLPYSVTVTCAAESPEAVAGSLPEDFEPARLDKLVRGERLYLNWSTAADYGPEVELLRRHLTEAGCGGLAMQLESGEGITLPPR